MNNDCGIYKITNIISNKCYIGKSVEIHERWKRHISNSKPIEEGGENYAINKAIRKYGANNFTFEILEKVPIDLLDEREKYWIQYFNSYYNGYNETLGGDGVIRYNYNEIINLWNEGNNCKQIEEILHCNDMTVTRALHSANITEEQIRQRSNYNKNKLIVAIDINTNTPLKIFNSTYEACRFLTKSIKEQSGIYAAVKNHYKWQGYYWDYLTNTNIPKKELNDLEFLSYQQNKNLILLTENKKSSLSNHKTKRCSREELKKLIRTLTFSEIGRKFKVSDNTIRKWCDYYNLPRRVKDIKNISDKEWELI